MKWTNLLNRNMRAPDPTEHPTTDDELRELRLRQLEQQDIDLKVARRMLADVKAYAQSTDNDVLLQILENDELD